MVTLRDVNWTGSGGYGIVPEGREARKWIEGTAQKLWKNINSIWDMLNVEVKTHDVVFNNDNFGSIPTFVDLSGITAGITGGINQELDVNGKRIGLDLGYRDGDKIRLKTVNVKGRVTMHTGTNTGRFYCMLVKHYENFSHLPPKYGDIYTSPNSNTTGQGLDLRNHEQGKQYRILARRTITVTGVEDRDNNKLFNLFYAFKRRVGSYVEWEGSASDDPSNGKIYLVYWSNGADIDMDCVSRITYIDN